MRALKFICLIFAFFPFVFLSPWHTQLRGSLLDLELLPSSQRRPNTYYGEDVGNNKDNVRLNNTSHGQGSSHYSTSKKAQKSSDNIWTEQEELFLLVLIYLNLVEGKRKTQSSSKDRAEWKRSKIWYMGWNRPNHHVMIKLNDFWDQWHAKIVTCQDPL